ncbi:MAG: helix-turn-helix transcriptional regulator [Candidatus Limnocylindrales bacterium]
MSAPVQGPDLDDPLDAWFDRLIVQLDDHWAAALEIALTGDERRGQVVVDDAAVGRAVLGDRSQALVPLQEVVEHVAGGGKLARLRAPEGLLAWQAVAISERGGRMYVLGAYDLVGLTQLAVTGPWPVADALLRTKIAKSDVERVRERLEPERRTGAAPGETVRALVGAAASDYLLSDKAWQDDGWPPVDWAVARFDPATGTATFVAHPAEWAIDQPSSEKRRGRLFRAIVRELQQDAVGAMLVPDRPAHRRADPDHGEILGHANRDRPRARPVGSIDVPTQDGSDLTIGDLLVDGAPGPEDEVEMREAAAAERERLVALAAALPALTERQREVIHRWAAGLPSGEIAQELGIAPGTVRATVNQTAKKLRKLLEKG